MTNTIPEFAEKISQFKEQYATDPAKLKFIEAFERAFAKPLTATAERELLNALTSGLSDWKDNPLNNAEVEINGFAKLLQDIREYESDTFSSSGSQISEAEVILVANKLIDSWSDNHLDGVSIAAVLDELRSEDEFSVMPIKKV